MEEKNKNEKLKLLLENIQKFIELYNDLNPEGKLSIASQDKKRDVSNIYICVYNDNNVGLFRKKDWSTKLRQTRSCPSPHYESGSI